MKLLYIIITLLLFTITTSCSKDWLEQKRDISLIVPTTLKDLRLLLNNDRPMAQDGRIFVELAADDYFAFDTQLDPLPQFWRSAYLWDRENLFGPIDEAIDWNTSYRQVLIANVVLEGLEKIEPTSIDLIEYNDIKGNALFFRAKAFHNLVETFAIPYNGATAKNDQGIPLQLNSDINTPIEFASMQFVWDRITTDLKEATKLLKPLPNVITNASRCSANAMLSRVYMCLEDYEQALYYANLSLEDKDDLMDYNDLNTAATYPITRFNKEVILHGEMAAYSSALMTINARTQKDLYNSYSDKDLRKLLFFRALSDNDFGYRGTYSGNAQVFSGFATNEMYLNRAECLARLDDPMEAMNTLNSLLITRYKKDQFTELTAVNKQIALDIILQERRKELLRRGLRWSDIRRLNNDPKYAKTFKRTYQENEYVLSPERIRMFAASIPYTALPIGSLNQ